MHTMLVVSSGKERNLRGKEGEVMSPLGIYGGGLCFGYYIVKVYVG